MATIEDFFQQYVKGFFDPFLWALADIKSREMLGNVKLAQLNFVIEFCKIFGETNAVAPCNISYRIIQNPQSIRIQDFFLIWFVNSLPLNWVS